MPCLCGDGEGVGLDSLRHAIKHLLEGPQTDRHPQHGGAKAWECAPTCSLDPDDFPQESAEPWPIARHMLRGDLRGVQGATGRTPPLMQDKVRHVHRKGRPLDHLVRRVGRGPCKRRMATGAPLGPALMHGHGRQEHLVVPGMPRFPTRFARPSLGRPLAPLLGGGVRRRWPVGGGRVLVETRLKLCDALAEVRAVMLHGTQGRLDRGRSLVPVMGRKGKRPRRAVRGSGLIHRRTRRRQGGGQFVHVLSRNNGRVSSEKGIRGRRKHSQSALEPLREFSGPSLSVAQAVPL
jgi:hypothetical protein